MNEEEIGRFRRSDTRTIAVRFISDHERFGDYVTVDTIVTDGEHKIATIDFAVSGHELPKLINMLQTAFRKYCSKSAKPA
jgi:hypothetical protein